MIAFLALLVLSIVGVVAGAFALPISKKIVMGWVRLYTAILPEVREARRDEILSDIHEHISSSLAEGYRPVEVAAQVLLRWVMGFPDDVAWCAPYLPSTLASKIARSSESLSGFRTPKLVIPSLATFGIMNWAYFSSDSNGAFVTWLWINLVTMAMILLISRQQHAWARRTLYTLIGVGGVAALGFVIWRIGPSRLNELIQLPLLQGFLLVMSAMALAMLFAGKSMRTRLFKGRWRYVVICWVLIVGVSLLASVALTGNVTPLFQAFIVIAGFVISLVVFCGIATLTATAVWCGCLRGSAAGLRIMSAGLRRLQ